MSERGWVSSTDIHSYDSYCHVFSVENNRRIEPGAVFLLHIVLKKTHDSVKRRCLTFPRVEPDAPISQAYLCLGEKQQPLPLRLSGCWLTVPRLIGVPAELNNVCIHPQICKTERRLLLGEAVKMSCHQRGLSGKCQVCRRLSRTKRSRICTGLATVRSATVVSEPAQPKGHITAGV